MHFILSSIPPKSQQKVSLIYDIASKKCSNLKNSGFYHVKQPLISMILCLCFLISPPFRGQGRYQRICFVVFLENKRKEKLLLRFSDLQLYVAYRADNIQKIISATSASNGSLIEWKIALFHKKNIFWQINVCSKSID